MAAFRDLGYNLTMSEIFLQRGRCIACGSSNLKNVAGGTFGSEPLRSFIDGDPWGENPLLVLSGESWSLVECTDCGQRFHGSILSPEWNEIRFSRWMSEDAIRQFEEEHGSNHDAARDVQHALRLKDLGVRRLLDFGCGFGQFLEMCHLFGIEAVRVDRSNARRSGAGVQVSAELDEVDGTFDAITMFEVLEHLDDPAAVLRRLVKRLRPQGTMIIEVPDTSGVSDIQDRESYSKIHPLDHINAFTPETLVGIMARVGLKPIPVAPAFVTTSLKRVTKDIAKWRLKANTTQRYFRAG
jgi:SAM-dependent methyltransferase